MSGSNRKRSGSGANFTIRMPLTRPPTTCPMARLMAPKPANASPTDTSVPSQPCTWSAIIFLWPRKLRSSSAAGTATTPLVTTVRARTRTTVAAAGAPIAFANAGALKYIPA